MPGGTTLQQGELESPRFGRSLTRPATPNAERRTPNASLPREQLETRHGAPDIRIFERVRVILFHAGDLVDPAVGFKHIDDKAIVGAMVD